MSVAVTDSETGRGDVRADGHVPGVFENDAATLANDPGPYNKKIIIIKTRDTTTWTTRETKSFISIFFLNSIQHKWYFTPQNQYNTM